MAKTIGPLLSFDASGQIGKALVYGTWKGRKYARQYVIPSNPRSTAQTETRNTFMWVHDAYKSLAADISAGWLARAKEMKITGPNAWASANISILRGKANQNDIIIMTSVGGGPPAGALTITPGANSLALTVVAPTIPAGWAIDQAVFFLQKQQQPSGELFVVPSSSLTKTATPWTETFTGLTTGTVYVVGAFFRYTRADGKKAFGGATTGTGTAA